MAILCPVGTTIDRLATKLLGRGIPFHVGASAGVSMGRLEAGPAAANVLRRLALNPGDLESFGAAAGAAGCPLSTPTKF